MTCVLYVMAEEQTVQGNLALLEAQTQALRYKLPLAVVFCLSPYDGVDQQPREAYDRKLDKLRQVETELTQLNIPFMLLIGDAEQRLNGMIYHLKPQAMFFDAGKAPLSAGQIKRHPYDWPGTIKRIDELQDYIWDETANTCN